MSIHYELESDRQCCGSSSGETHRVVRVEIALTKPEPFCSDIWPSVKTKTTVAVFRRRDMAEELCGEFNKPTGIVLGRHYRDYFPRLNAA